MSTDHPGPGSPDDPFAKRPRDGAGESGATGNGGGPPQEGRPEDRPPDDRPPADRPPAEGGPYGQDSPYGPPPRDSGGSYGALGGPYAGPGGPYGGGGPYGAGGDRGEGGRGGQGGRTGSPYGESGDPYRKSGAPPGPAPEAPEDQGPSGGGPYTGGPQEPSRAPDPMAGMPPLASGGKRLFARIIDIVIVLVPAYLLEWAAVGTNGGDVTAGRSAVGGVFAAGLGFVYEYLMTRSTGQTIGKRATNIRTAMLADGSVPTSAASVARAAVLWLPVFCCYIIWFLVIGVTVVFDRPYRQGLPDKLAKTVVVEIP